MAKSIKPINTGTVDPHTFDKSLVEDVTGFHLPSSVWTQARNATPNTERGDLGELSNEQSNLFCNKAPYTIIGMIHLEEDKWVIFSTDETDSEIGLFNEGLCEYNVIVNDQCLNFSKLHLIKGESKENSDCTWQVYWDDGDNLSRTLNINDVPWIENCVTDPAGCITCSPTTNLDCDAIRLAPLITNPCFRLEKGPQGGELLNGSYFVVGAYLLNEQRISDYSVPSNVQSLFAHIGQAGSLEIIVEEMDEDFDEFELVLIQIRNLKTVAKKIGIYSTRTSRISIDIVDDRNVTIPLTDIPLRNAVIAKSDAMFRNGDYMIRTGPTNKFDFNYQPLANQIGTEWVSVEYPADYYRKGGNKTNYLRDEVYPFFIRWVYDTGDKTPSYHIPGRIATAFDNQIIAGQDAAIEIAAGITPNRWRVYNTASVNGSFPTSTLSDGGVVIAGGPMAYWESTEKYDDDVPEVWNSTYVDPSTGTNIGGTTNTAFDLCGLPIRHHKFPDNVKGNASVLPTNHYNTGGTKIRIMAVQFNNIKPPVDNLGVPIQGVVGYEIMRGTREGNKSIVAKGMINNMREHAIPGGITNRTGLYPNYPYNPTHGIGQADKFLEFAPGLPNTFVNKSHFTFHSPDTSFKDPFLSFKEIALYGENVGVVNGKFEYPNGHPKHKLITDTTFLIAALAGVGYALIKKNGDLRTTKIEPRVLNMGSTGIFAGVAGAGFSAAPGFGSGNASIPTPAVTTQLAMVGGMSAGSALQVANKQAGGFILSALVGLGPTGYYSALNTKINGGTAGAINGVMGGYTEETTDGGTSRQMPTVLGAINGVLDFSLAVSEGAEVILRLIRSLSQSNQYAVQYQSHCFYNSFGLPQTGSSRFAVKESLYLDPDIQDFGTSHRINNLYRSRTVALETQLPVNDCITVDNTQQTVADVGMLNNPTDTPFATQAASHYVGLKQRLRNQYGQLEGVIQIPATTCMTPLSQTTTDVIFGGDTYIGRYTEKNTMFFFYNWLRGQPDYEELDYRDYEMIPYPKYWANFIEYDFNEAFSGIASNLLNPSSWSSFLPGGRHNLDGGGGGGVFVSNSHYFHLFNSGVRDFFVESEINIDLRDWGDEDSERHYDPYGYSDIGNLFDTGIIKSGNFYKYDFSLSIARLYNSVTSWGHTHRRDYDPYKSASCFVYRPNRVVYSLRQNLENKKDYWKVFLPNNYKDFKSRVTAIKPVNKNGALILFENESPVEFKGVDTLQTDGGTKLTIGDGGLFSQPLQNVLNTDDSYEYGSCQNRLSVINTASGIFWMSQNQGKIFQIQNGIKEISTKDIKYWLATYLPYVLTLDFPDFELTDNPVAGIGCQSIYDNEKQLVYFCKRDYKLKTDIVDVVTYTGSGDDFLVNGRLRIKLGHPDYFDEAHWTLSYDPKTGGWVGYHDWHPNLLMPTKNNFLSIMNDGLWRHNYRCDSYCNYYGVDYPFEVEYATVTPQVVNTLRSIEYYMEVHKYDDNCYDRFHVLDFNFDEAVIYNSEQCSGLLSLNLSPKNDAPGMLNYPQINPASIDILFSKEEQKYRFNQFWDITADRGEFNAAAERMIWNTEANGYIRNLNPNNLDYNKFQTERKKFRHYKNTVLLRRRVCGNRSMSVSIANNKNLKSPR